MEKQIMNTPQNAIETDNLTKRYGQKTAVDHLSFALPRGMILGLLGRNGAGKTTTIRMLMGLETPSSGSARVLDTDTGHWTPELRSRVGYLAEGHHLYSWMSVRRVGEFQKAFYPKWDDHVFDGVIEHFKVRPRQKVGGLSRGQRAGICLALTLAPDPELLILDDPALGLDPVARRNLIEAMVYATRQKGRTILFSSHILSDVERVCDRIAVMDAGRLRAHCTVDEFRERVRLFTLKFDAEPPHVGPDFPGLLQVFRTERELRISCVTDGTDVERDLGRYGPRVISEDRLGLEEAFVR